MLALLFTICMIWIFGKMLLFGIRATWRISKFLIAIVLLPVALLIRRGECLFVHKRKL